MYGETFSNRCLAITPAGTHLSSLKEEKVLFGDREISTGDFLLSLENETTPVIFIQKDRLGTIPYGTGILKIWNPHTRKGVCTKDFSLKTLPFEKLNRLIESKGKSTNYNGWFPIID